MTRNDLLRMHKDEKESLEHWKWALKHAVWVPDGKGGCVNKEKELIKSEARVALLAEMLKHYFNLIV